LITDPEALVGRIEPGPEGTFVGEARIEYYGDGKARKGKLLVMSRRPADLRMEVQSFTDDLISVLAVNGEGFTFFERGRKECLKGPVCAAPVASRFPMVSAPDKLVPLLLGKVPLLPQPDSRKLDFSREEGLYVLELEKGKLRQVVKVRPDGMAVAEAAMWEDGRLTVRISFEGTISAGGTAGEIPRTVRLVAPEHEADLSIEYREIEFGYEFQGDPFVFECPKGTVVEELDCGTE